MKCFASLARAAASSLLAQQPQQQESVSIRFKATVGEQELACGKSYVNIGITKPTIQPRDFRSREKIPTPRRTQ